MRVLITGGTGRLAHHIFAHSAAAALSWRVLSRRPAADNRDWAVGDLVSGTGVAAALEGVEAVLHLASDPAQPARDVRATEHLVRAAGTAGVRHLLFLSIVGVDRIPYPYYEAKRAAERIIEEGAVPWTVLRAAQFHSFVDWLLAQALRLPGLIVVPAGFRVQSVAEEDMAQRLLDALAAGPVGRAADFAGPEILRASDAARQWRRAKRLRRAVAPVPVPGRVARAFRTGANTAPDGDRGVETWGAWLARRYAVPPETAHERLRA